MLALYLRRGRFVWLGVFAIVFSLAAGSVLERAAAQPTGRAARAPNAKQPPAKSRPLVPKPQLQPADPTKPGVRPAESPIIEFDKPVYNFGRIMAGKPVRHDFRFTNRGNQSLLITQVKPSCGCAKAGPYDKKVAPGKSGKIPISMNTSRLEGKTRKWVVVTTNDPGLPTLRLQLSGEIVPLVKVDPPSVFFGVFQDERA